MENQPDSGFTSLGFKETCPNFHIDRAVLEVIGNETRFGYVYSDSYLEDQISLYGRFLQRTDTLASHRGRANANMDRYLFEMAFRDGVYDLDLNKQLEDESC